MSVLIPESASRLQSHCFVSDVELLAVGRSSVIRQAAKEMARR